MVYVEQLLNHAVTFLFISFFFGLGLEQAAVPFTSMVNARSEFDLANAYTLVFSVAFVDARF